MFKLIGILLAGVVGGWLLRNVQLQFTQVSVTFLVWMLLFVLGLEVGARPDVVQNLPTLGGYALLFALLSTAGAIIPAWLLGRKERAMITEQAPAGEEKAPFSFVIFWQQWGDNILILLIFAIGLLLGLNGKLQDVIEADLSMPLLMLLMFMVGFSVGHTSSVLKQFLGMRWNHLLLPFTSIIGSLAGGLFAALLLGIPLLHGLAVGAGQGYYSLSSVLITEHVSVALGTIALLANIIRELLTVLTAPLLARYFGPLAPIASGGATTMDVTLPFILNSSGPDYLVTSIYHGFICDLSVPILVTLLIT